MLNKLLFSDKVMFMLTERKTNSHLGIKDNGCDSKILEGIKLSDNNGFPELKQFNGATNFSMVAYTDRKCNDGKNQAVHFFLDDFKFRYATCERLISTTYQLGKFDYIFTPDYSLYVDLPDIYNKVALFKTRLAGAFWQKCGYNVIPTASWGNANSFKYCFEGLPNNSIIGVSGIGHKKNYNTEKLWCYGIRELEYQKNPTAILVYGPETQVPGLKTPIKFYPDFITLKFRKK